MDHQTGGGIIFDLDGTLIETEQVWRDVRRDFVAAHGGRWHDGAHVAMIGMRTSEWASYIHDDLGVAMAPEEIAALVVRGVVAQLANVPVLPGAEAALRRLAGAFPLGLATSAARPVADTVLAKTGWGRFFKAVVSADEVKRGKPAPDVFARALEMMGLDAARAAAVEDSGNGIRSAHAARLTVIAIPNREFSPEPDAIALAARVVSNLDALTVPLLRQLLTKVG